MGILAHELRLPLRRPKKTHMRSKLEEPSRLAFPWFFDPQTQAHWLEANATSIRALHSLSIFSPTSGQ
jgi:hypothetical protein